MKPESTNPKSFPTASVSRSGAAALVDAALAAAAKMDIEISVAVTDAAGHLRAFERTDQALFLTVDVAINKAWTAASFGMATHVWNSMLATKPEVAQLANIPRLMPVGGGCPITEKGMLVGGIGISGGNDLQDRQAAETALKALGFEVPD